jgi:transcriptional regulator with XRE-family HTH domain
MKTSQRHQALRLPDAASGVGLSGDLQLAHADQAVHANRAGSILRSARIACGLSLRELAVLVGTSHATLSAYEQGRKVPSVSTFLRVVEACNCDVSFELTPRIRHADGIARGDELADVLLLAEQFPSQSSARLDMPVFPGGQ